MLNPNSANLRMPGQKASANRAQFNIVSPQFKANPFDLMANLRASQPVFRTALPDKTPVWLLTLYEDVAGLLKDERFVKDKRKAMTPDQLRKMPWVLNAICLTLILPITHVYEHWSIRLLLPAWSHRCANEFKYCPMSY
jgi:cytochrome P450